MLISELGHLGVARRVLSCFVVAITALLSPRVTIVPEQAIQNCSVQKARPAPALDGLFVATALTGLSFDLTPKETNTYLCATLAWFDDVVWETTGSARKGSFHDGVP